MSRLLVVLALLLGLVTPGWSLDWGGIEPGVSTLEQVRERYGAPSKETRAKVEGYDTIQWVYEDMRAPAGLVRMTVDFGMLTPAGYKPTVVRIFKLEPKPFIFGRATVVQGWGVPDGISTQDGIETYVYTQGLFVMFDRAGEHAVTMVFSPPQPDAVPASPAPAAPAQRPPASPGPRR